MHKRFELFMAITLLISVFILARKGARLVAAMNGHESSSVIVIDAGHGGSDPGKVGINGALEKDINLTLAQKLAPLFENKGYTVILTRTTDTTLYNGSKICNKKDDMQQRINIIAAADPILVLSIHQNSFTEESVCGPQVFYYSKSEDGKNLALHLSETLNTTLSVANPREIKPNTDYFLLKKSPTPTVIVECGFLSNSSEAQQLLDEQYQNKIVRAIYKGIIDTLESS